MHVLLCLSTGAHWGWHNSQFCVEVLVQPVVPCPQPEDGNLLRSCKQVEAVFLCRCSEQSFDDVVKLCEAYSVVVLFLRGTKFSQIVRFIITLDAAVGGDPLKHSSKALDVVKGLLNSGNDFTYFLHNCHPYVVYCKYAKSLFL